ncbi:MAG: DNA-binding protein, partial [Thermacetogeniaceae bacterium]
KESGGLTVGILPDRHSGLASEYIDIPVVTGMGDARNYINVLTSDVVIALPGGAGTVSEVALALKNRKTVILLGFDPGRLFDGYRDAGLLRSAATPEEAVELVKALFPGS